MTDPTDDAIRNQYANKGVEAYYRESGASYSNPHFPYVRSLLLRNQHRIDYQNILDFCCGSGEVSQVVRELGFSDITASDPYTGDAFQKTMGLSCYPWSFKDVIRGKWEGSYSAVICSFAMHLCPEEQLYPLAHQLLSKAPLLVIITPHKRPNLSKVDGISLVFEDSVLTERGKAVRMKGYGVK
jgi:hypothetical protein